MIKSISIIYPIYNEQKRLSKTIKDIKKFDKSNNSLKKEYILVNDGSTDKTLSLLKKKIDKNIRIKIINYKINRGKGYALKLGVRHAQNQWILTTDSDCSVSNFQLTNWIKNNYINNKTFIYFGSRNLPNSLVKKKLIRKIIGNIFIFILRMLFQINLSDTQCGFKLYKSIYAKKIFKNILTDGYMHDIEICIISKKLNLKITELPVTWMHMSESKINFPRDFIKIFFNLLKIKQNNYDKLQK
jgi:dolichyl-phosphate beta-glucosyltransferase